MQNFSFRIFFVAFVGETVVKKTRKGREGLVVTLRDAKRRYATRRDTRRDTAVKVSSSSSSSAVEASRDHPNLGSAGRPFRGPRISREDTR